MPSPATRAASTAARRRRALRRSPRRSSTPDPGQFGLPTAADGARDDVLIGQHMRTCCWYEPDFAALRAAPTRIVLAQAA